jgi:Type VI secretion system/phage-baseplate injector OB domain
MPIEVNELQMLESVATERRDHFFGKYRGTVVEALTGDDLGKLTVTVPSVLGDEQMTAWPCVPFAGPSHGFVAIPEKDDGVWIEFEGGDPSQPIWVGCWWGSGDVPSPGDIKVRSWVTSGGLAIVMDDDKNELSLIHPDGPSIKLSSDGITLSTDSATVTLDTTGISLKGSTDVSQ